MALYTLDETGEAKIEVDIEEWAKWRGHATEKDLTLARHDIIEYRGVITAIDVLRHPYHNGKVISTVVTRLTPNCRDASRHPWEIGVLGEDPEYTTSTREQAASAHKQLVNWEIKAHNGRVLI